MTTEQHRPVQLDVYPSELCPESCHHTEAKEDCPTGSVTACEHCTFDGLDLGVIDVVMPALWPCPPGRRAALNVVPGSHP